MTHEELVAAVQEKARILYEGKEVPHRSCGMCIAETFGLEPRPYHALRRGGITGEGECGAVVAGRLVLGELFGAPGSDAPTSDALRAAVVRFQAEVARRVARGPGGTLVCNDLTAPYPDFQSEGRAAACTTLSAEVARIVAEIVLELGGTIALTPIPRP